MKLLTKEIEKKLTKRFERRDRIDNELASTVGIADHDEAVVKFFNPTDVIVKDEPPNKLPNDNLGCAKSDITLYLASIDPNLCINLVKYSILAFTIASYNAGSLSLANSGCLGTFFRFLPTNGILLEYLPKRLDIQFIPFITA